MWRWGKKLQDWATKSEISQDRKNKCCVISLICGKLKQSRLVVARDWESGEGNGTPLQYSCLEDPTDGGTWWAAVHGVVKSRTRLSNFTFPFHFHALERKWQPTPVFLPGESQGWRSLVRCHLRGRTLSDTTEAT